MDSFKSGVDSPDNMASLTIQVPLMSRISAGTVVSIWCRARVGLERLVIAIARNCLTDGNYVPR